MKKLSCLVLLVFLLGFCQARIGATFEEQKSACDVGKILLYGSVVDAGGKVLVTNASQASKYLQVGIKEGSNERLLGRENDFYCSANEVLKNKISSCYLWEPGAEGERIRVDVNETHCSFVQVGAPIEKWHEELGLWDFFVETLFGEENIGFAWFGSLSISAVFFLGFFYFKKTRSWKTHHPKVLGSLLFVCFIFCSAFSSFAFVILLFYFFSRAWPLVFVVSLALVFVFSFLHRKFKKKKFKGKITSKFLKSFLALCLVWSLSLFLAFVLTFFIYLFYYGLKL